jgi:hypothetical protein
MHRLITSWLAGVGDDGRVQPRADDSDEHLVPAGADGPL